MSEDQKRDDQGTHGGRKQYELFVDAKVYHVDHENITGAQIKALAGVPDSYQLFLEEPGETPDRLISDAETVNLEGKVKHFFAVPPATFGLL